LNSFSIKEEPLNKPITSIVFLAPIDIYLHFVSLESSPQPLKLGIAAGVVRYPSSDDRSLIIQELLIKKEESSSSHWQQDHRSPINRVFIQYI
jgi:hypothetical protein